MNTVCVARRAVDANANASSFWEAIVWSLFTDISQTNEPNQRPNLADSVQIEEFANISSITAGI